MKRSTGAKRQQNETVLYAVLGVVLAGCVGYVYYEFSAPATSPPPAAVVRSAPAAAVRPATTTTGSTAAPTAGMRPASATTASQLDPALHMEAMEVTESLEYAGSGRNIFSPNSAPPPPRAMPVPEAPVRPETFVRPPTVAPGPAMPVLAPIDLKFFGTATTEAGKKSVFLLRGEDVYRASEGDVVARKYKVITIGAKSVVMEDLSDNNRQTIPMENP